MQLYRLDTNSGPVTDLLGPRLFRAQIVARSAGIAHAKDTGEEVTLSTITRNLALRKTLSIDPNGRCRRLTY